MSKKRCLDNPSLPNKAFRDIIVKRYKREQARVMEALTPALAEAWNEFKAEGRVIADKAACELKLQIGNALVQALDGALDLDTLSCNYCKQTCAEDARRQRCVQEGKVCSSD